MKFVVDSNVLFTYFWKSSVFGDFCSRQDLKLFTPEYALIEINKYSEEIMKKVKISKYEFKKLRINLALKVGFIPIEEYKDCFDEVKFFLGKLKDNVYSELLNDIDFFATAVKYKCPIWSNDKLFKKQSAVVVFTTKELIELLSEP
jgi:predicted nucleic acid-binding protein